MRYLPSKKSAKTQTHPLKEPLSKRSKDRRLGEQTNEPTDEWTDNLLFQKSESTCKLESLDQSPMHGLFHKKMVKQTDKQRDEQAD